MQISGTSSRPYRKNIGRVALRELVKDTPRASGASDHPAGPMSRDVVKAIRCLMCQPVEEKYCKRSCSLPDYAGGYASETTAFVSAAEATPRVGHTAQPRGHEIDRHAHQPIGRQRVDTAEVLVAFWLRPLMRTRWLCPLPHTSTAPVDPVHAHGVIVYLPFLTTSRYFLENVRAVAPSAFVVFDFFTEDCMVGESVAGWLAMDQNCPLLLSVEAVTDRFEAWGFALREEFSSRLGAARSHYALF